MIFPSNSESFVEGLKSTTLLFKTMFLFLALKTTVVDSTRFWGYPFESILLSYLKHAICHPKWQVYDTESKEFLNQKSYVFSVFLTKKKSPSDVSSVEMFFFGKSWRMYFFHVAHIELLKISWRGTLESPGRFSWKYQRSKTCGKPRWTPSVSGWEPGCCFFWWTAGGEHRANALHQRFGETSPGYHLGSVILSAFLKTLFRGLAFVWVSAANVGAIMYIFIYIYILYIYIYIYVQLYAYDFYIIYIYI